MGFTDWLRGQTKQGLVPDPIDDREMQKKLSEYYTHYVDVGRTTGSVPQSATTSTSGGTLTNANLQNAYQQMYTNSSGTTFNANTWDNWTKEEKKTLAKVGFHYDKKKNEWVIDMTATIRIPQLEGFQMLMQGAGDKPTDQAIAQLKQLKEMIVEKITAKIILAEMIKPREIKE